MQSGFFKRDLILNINIKVHLKIFWFLVEEIKRTLEGLSKASKHMVDCNEENLVPCKKVNGNRLN